MVWFITRLHITCFMFFKICKRFVMEVIISRQLCRYLAESNNGGHENNESITCILSIINSERYLLLAFQQYFSVE